MYDTISLILMFNTFYNFDLTYVASPLRSGIAIRNM